MTPFRGFTIDAARLPEPLPTYRRLLDLLAGWGFNAVLLRLTDDQGSAYRFASHPELITHRHAFGADELRAFVAYAGERGIEVIPEIESFGHARFIVDVPRHAHLFDGQPPEPGRIIYNSLSPVDPGSHALIADLYAEIAAVVPGRFLHGGCDEVNWGHSEASRRAIAERGRWAIWVDYVNRLATTARALGRELIVWADHILRQDGNLDGLDRSLILHDWEYWTGDAEVFRARGERAIALGHRLIGGPAVIYSGWGPRAGEAQFANLQAFADSQRQLDAAHALGVIVTDWLPTRTVPWGNLDLVHAAGACLGGADLGRAAERERVTAEYVERHFGAPWDERWRNAFALLYRLAPTRHCPRDGGPPQLIAPWADEAAVRALHASGAPDDPGYGAIAAELARVAPTVTANHGDFTALSLTADYLRHLWWRSAAAVRAVRDATAGRAATADLTVIARADAELVERLERQWTTARHADDLGSDPRLAVEMPDPRDHLYRSMRAAAEFSARLARDPDLLAACTSQSVDASR